MAESMVSVCLAVSWTTFWTQCPGCHHVQWASAGAVVATTANAKTAMVKVVVRIFFSVLPLPVGFKQEACHPAGVHGTLGRFPLSRRFYGCGV